MRGPAAGKLAAARQSLFLMETEPEKSLRCGPLAAGKVWMALNPQQAMPGKVVESVCTDHGTSLVQTQAFAKTLGLDLQMAKRSPGAEILVPSVVKTSILPRLLQKIFVPPQIRA